MNPGAQTTLASFGNRPMTTQLCILTLLPEELGPVRERIDIGEMGYFGWGRTKEAVSGFYGEETLVVHFFTGSGMLTHTAFYSFSFNQ